MVSVRIYASCFCSLCVLLRCVALRERRATSTVSFPFQQGDLRSGDRRRRRYVHLCVGTWSRSTNLARTTYMYISKRTYRDVCLSVCLPEKLTYPRGRGFVHTCLYPLLLLTSSHTRYIEYRTHPCRGKHNVKDDSSAARRCREEARLGQGVRGDGWKGNR